MHKPIISQWKKLDLWIIKKFDLSREKNRKTDIEGRGDFVDLVAFKIGHFLEIVPLFMTLCPVHKTLVKK